MKGMPCNLCTIDEFTALFRFEKSKIQVFNKYLSTEMDIIQIFLEISMGMIICTVYFFMKATISCRWK